MWKNRSEKNFKKLTSDSSSSTPITLRSTLIKKYFFVKKVVLCIKKSIRKKNFETNIRFEFLDPDYPSVNTYKKIFLCEKSRPLYKKNRSQKKFKKLTSDSSSSTPITQGPTKFQASMVNYYEFLKSMFFWPWCKQTYTQTTYFFSYDPPYSRGNIGI